MKKFLSILLILTLLSLGGGSALAQEPTAEATAEPTQEATAEATAEPTQEATAEPTAEPTQEPTVEPTVQPTAEPTDQPTAEPTDQPTAEPTTEPTAEPTVASTDQATAEPTTEPTVEATIVPTVEITTTPVITAEVSAGEIDSQALTTIPFTSRVGVMDMSGAGANFSLSYYNESSKTGTGGAARGTNAGLALSAFQMRIIDQATDTNINNSAATLKGSGILQSNNPLAAAVFFGGTSAGSTQFEAYDSGGFYSPGTKFFIPNGNKNVGAASRVNSEIAIQNTDSTTAAVVDVKFVIQNITKSFTVAPNSTYYYIIKDDTSAPLITDQLQQPLVITSRNGQKIMVVNSAFSTVGAKFLSDTPGFKPEDAAAVQFLPNILFRLSNGLSVITFIQNVSTSPVDVTATFVPDPTCTIPACTSGNILRTATINPNAVASFNPRVDNSLPAGWFGSVKVSTNNNSASIIAFGNQLTAPGASSGTAAAGYGARNANNTNTSLFCPFLISGLPNYNATSQASTLLIQNIGNAATNVTVQFIGGVGSPTNFNTVKPAVNLASGARLSFNFRSNTAANGGVPANWFGAARITSNGGKIAAVANLFNKITSTTDPLGSYNCISPN